MNIIVPMNKDIFNIIGNQTYYPNKKYIDIPYKISVEIEGSLIVENTLTRQVIEYSKDESLKDNEKFLVENWFLLPEDMSPKTLSYMIRYSIKSKREQNQNDAIDSYTIFTTMACNARCPYCYEKGRVQKSMSIDIANDALKFISNHRKSRKVMFNWFGGEPLVNGPIITHMCEYLQNNNIPYQSTMISNGYLFSEYPDDVIKNVWKLQHVQITIDGTEENYNHIKGYVNNPDNAFSTVINNIHHLLELGVRVTIRMNQSVKNGDDLLDLVDFLAKEFDGCTNITAYAHPLFGNTIQPLTDTEWDSVYDKFINIDRKLKSKHLRIYSGIGGVNTCNCMADDGHSICITADGNLTMCEHYSDEEIVGNIWDGITDLDRVAEWKSIADEYECCASCWRYPKCLRLKKCQVEDECSFGMIKYWKYNEIQAIKRIYGRYLTNLKQQEEARKPFDKQILLDITTSEIGKTLADRNYWDEIFHDVKECGWCTAFIYAMFRQAYPRKLSILFRTKYLATHPFGMAAEFKKRDLIYDIPEVGDIVFYRVHTWISHVGIVVAVSDDGKRFDSIEGNIIKDGVSKVCKLNDIPISDSKIIGFGRLNFQNITL